MTSHKQIFISWVSSTLFSQEYWFTPETCIQVFDSRYLFNMNPLEEEKEVPYHMYEDDSLLVFKQVSLKNFL